MTDQCHSQCQKRSCLARLVCKPGRVWRLSIRAAAIVLCFAACLLTGPWGSASASSLEDIRQLEDLINAAGVTTAVSDSCPVRHAGYYETDGSGRHRLVLCRNVVKIGRAHV